ARFFVLEVPFVVGAAVVRSVAIGPSPGNGLGRDLPLDISHRATLVVRIGSVRPVVSPRDSVCYRVVGKPERVPKSEDIDLIAYLVLRIGLRIIERVEEVPVRDGVGVPFTGFHTFLNVIQYGDAQDCTTQVVGVARAPSGVDARVHSRRVVDGWVSV